MAWNGNWFAIFGNGIQQIQIEICVAGNFSCCGGCLHFLECHPDSSPWYVKHMDFGRPSAQHRVAAWKAGFEMMWGHPLCVGWNKAAGIYEKNYSAPENGAAAITMNSYLMLGTELGLPGIICFVAYVALRLGVGRWN